LTESKRAVTFSSRTDDCQRLGSADPLARRSSAAIKRPLAETNGNARPFVWTADPDKIIGAVTSGYQTLNSIR
jgi:hypothetical protein